ncbi:MAG: hypothetical protein KC933_41385, partial [Myxococcales bacterium]|nr:hypothetical protein [Myxococcales bacterium]
MSELSPEARALVDAARMERPDAAAKAAIKARVMTQVAAGAPVATAAAKGASVAKLLGGGALTVGLLAGA